MTPVNYIFCINELLFILGFVFELVFFFVCYLRARGEASIVQSTKYDFICLISQYRCLFMKR